MKISNQPLINNQKEYKLTGYYNMTFSNSKGGGEMKAKNLFKVEKLFLEYAEEKLEDIDEESRAYKEALLAFVYAYKLARKEYKTKNDEHPIHEYYTTHRQQGWVNESFDDE